MGERVHDVVAGGDEPTCRPDEGGHCPLYTGGGEDVSHVGERGKSGETWTSRASKWVSAVI